MRRPFGSPILDLVSRLLIPFILLYALYVLLHGHYSPGGGFQSGVLFAVAMILLRLVWGDDIPWGLPRWLALRMAAGGVLLFAVIGLLPLFFGGNFLDYGFLPLGLPAAKTRMMGTLGIEIGVGLAVTGVLYLIYEALTEGPREE